jgi:glutamate dehydrogenase/leucine dehydrogenase
MISLGWQMRSSRPDRSAFEATLHTALQYRVDMRMAAYMVAINRVATVTRMRGMYA